MAHGPARGIGPWWTSDSVGQGAHRNACSRATPAMGAHCDGMRKERSFRRFSPWAEDDRGAAENDWQ
jgi:hypothetical protein